MKFVAFERTLQGTGASRRLRNSGRTPAIVYGGSVEPTRIELDHNALWHASQKEAFHASVLDMELAGKTEQVMLRDIQYHPFKQQVLHVDFQRVTATTVLHKKVPLHFVNENESPAVKIDKCLISHVINEIDVSCQASKLPEHITVDLSALTKGQSIHASELVLPEGVKLVDHGHGGEQTVAIAVAPKGASSADAAAAAA
jgi:large subunit ribosomal protein L25